MRLERVHTQAKAATNKSKNFGWYRPKRLIQTARSQKPSPTRNFPAHGNHPIASVAFTVALPKDAKHWSLMRLRQKLIRIGAEIVSRGRYVVFQMAEVPVPRKLFQQSRWLMDGLRTNLASA